MGYDIMFQENRSGKYKLPEAVVFTGTDNEQVYGIRYIEWNNGAVLTSFPDGNELPGFCRSDLSDTEPYRPAIQFKYAGSVFNTFCFRKRMRAYKTAFFINKFNSSQKISRNCSGMPGSGINNSRVLVFHPVKLS